MTVDRSPVAYEVRVESDAWIKWLIVPATSTIRALARAHDAIDGDSYTFTGTTFHASPTSVTTVVHARPKVGA